MSQLRLVKRTVSGSDVLRLHSTVSQGLLKSEIPSRMGIVASRCALGAIEWEWYRKRLCEGYREQTAFGSFENVFLAWAMAVVVPIRRGRAELMTLFVERNGAEDRSTANLHGR